MKLNLEWVEKIRVGNQASKLLYLNGIVVGKYYPVVNYEDQEEKFEGYATLPSFGGGTIFASTEKKIEVDVENRVDAWFEQALRSRKERNGYRL